MIGPAPICMTCKHYHFDNYASMTCDAYPDGIPEKIIMNEVDHRKPYKNDNGLTYQPKPNVKE
jgi:hypothetical protein